MKGNLCLLAIQDAALAAAARDALADCVESVEVELCADLAALPQLARDRQAGVVVLAAADRPDGAEALVRELTEHPETPVRSIVIFEDAADARRAPVAKAGAHDYLADPERALGSLASLVDRVLSREALRERLDASTGRFEALVQGSNDAIYILKNRRIAYVNPTFCELVRIPAEELTAPDFSILDNLIAPESYAYLEERQQRIAAGEPVESRYEFVSRRRGAENFDALVSISYIDFEGEPASLGIMQDITERKRFEQQLLQKNRELALLNELTASISTATKLDETLRVGCQRVTELLHVRATGITLLDPTGGRLLLRESVGFDAPLRDALSSLKVDSSTLIGAAVTSGKVLQVGDLSSDDRVGIPKVREADFASCTVVPLVANSKKLGAFFVFTGAGELESEEEQRLVRSIGMLLGTAIEKASLLDQERDAVRRLQALDAIALAVNNSLDIDEVAHTVARNVRHFFGPRRIILARFDSESGRFVPLCSLDGDDTWDAAPPLPQRDTLMGMAMAKCQPLQRVTPKSPCADEVNAGEELPPYALSLFEEGFGSVVAIPVLHDDVGVGGILLAFDDDCPIAPGELEALAAMSTHVAIAMQNARLFAARNQALQDLKDAQEKLLQSERLNALGELAAGVAHDFNNVLGAILGRAQMLKRALDEPALRKHADIIERAATDGAETVRRIQEIGRQDLADDLVPVDVVQIVKDVVELTHPRWFTLTREENRPVDLKVENEVTDDTLVSANPHELREVLINLVHNAVDALSHGGTIVLRTAVEDHNGGRRVLISVRDDGPGIPDEVRQRIFDPFFTTKGDKGTGLGLSVSFSIIKRHGGELDVHSSSDPEHPGTTFCIWLPELVDAPCLDETVDIDEEAFTEASQAADEEAEVVEDGAARVLVIDDEENIREILTDILLTGGHDVVTVANGPDGLEVLREGRFDLVLTDLSLPGMTGYEVASAIHAEHQGIAVGLVTGWGATLDDEKVRGAGIDLVLNKPFRFGEVLEAVDNLLRERGKTR